MCPLPHGGENRNLLDVFPVEFRKTVWRNRFRRAWRKCIRKFSKTFFTIPKANGFNHGLAEFEIQSYHDETINQISQHHLENQP